MTNALTALALGLKAEDCYGIEQGCYGNKHGWWARRAFGTSA